MADILGGLQGGGTEVMGSMGGMLQGLMQGVNMIMMVFVAMLIIAGMFAIIWVLNEYMFSFKTPVTLRYEVGNTIIKKKDKFRIRKKGDKLEIQFKKNKKVIAEEPDDTYSFFVKGGFGSAKSFEAFVRNNQATWVDPKPVIGMMTETRIYKNEDGEDVKQEFHRPTFITMKSNLKRYFMDVTRKNMELDKNVKWWQNPQVMAFGMMSVFLVGVIFIYLMNKSSVEVAKQTISMAASVMEQASGQVVG